MSWLAVLAGGGLGALSRWLLGRALQQLWPGSFPAGTLVVNLLGCLVIGFLFGLFERRAVPPELRLFLVTGFLGGFTTFSSFGVETFALARDREWLPALLNVLLSNALGIALVVAGFALAMLVTSQTPGGAE